MWCNEVNDLLEVNFRGIQKLYQLFANSGYFPKYNRVKGLMPDKASIDQILCTLKNPKIAYLNLNLTDKHIIVAFYLSKQTVALEVENSNYEYTFIHWPEFLEFLCRLAWLKYKENY